MEFNKENFEETVNYLKNKYKNIQTYRKHISFILSEIRNDEFLNEKLQLMYRNELYRCIKIIEDIPKEPFDESLQLEKLREIWKQRNIIDRHGLIVGLYLFIPALRSDYAESYIKDDVIYITLGKVNKGEIVSRKVPDELKSFMHIYKALPTKRDVFANYVGISSKKIFGIKITINVLRRIWTEFGLRTMSISEQRDLAYLMNHSWEMHMKEYTPLMKIVYK